jgi:hypothetical protein
MSKHLTSDNNIFRLGKARKIPIWFELEQLITFV